MKRTAIALIAVAGVAGVANAQIFEIVVDRTLVDTQVDADGIVNFSLFMDTQASGAGFLASFTGWAGYSGDFSSGGGVFAAPMFESGAAGDGANGGSVATWSAGRRSPAFFGVPGGAAGGFRFAPQGYEAGAGFLRGTGNTLIEGIAASSALGGFSQDASVRLEVFKGTIDYFAAAPGVYSLDFNAATGDVFIDGAHNTVRSVFALLGNTSATITVVPTPASFMLLGLGGIAAGRRRR